jgi:hypothetical protein
MGITWGYKQHILGDITGKWGVNREDNGDIMTNLNGDTANRQLSWFDFPSHDRLTIINSPLFMENDP